MNRIVPAGDARAWRLEPSRDHRSASSPFFIRGGPLLSRGESDEIAAPYPAEAARRRGFDPAGLWVRCEETREAEPLVVVMEFVQTGIAGRPGETGNGRSAGPVDISPWLADRDDDEIRALLEDPQALDALSLPILTALHAAGNPTVRHGTGRMGPAAMDGIVRLEVLDLEATRAGLEETLRRHDPSPEPFA